MDRITTRCFLALAALTALAACEAFDACWVSRDADSVTCEAVGLRTRTVCEERACAVALAELDPSQALYDPSPIDIAPADSHDPAPQTSDPRPEAGPSAINRCGFRAMDAYAFCTSASHDTAACQARGEAVFEACMASW